MSTRYDVIVIGGGMVGAALAAMLGDANRVAVVEAAPVSPVDRRDPVDLRVSALSLASRRLLDAVGAWDSVEQVRVSPFRQMRVWDAASAPFSDEALHFDSARIGEAQLGHIVENRLIQWALHRRLQTMRNVEVFSPARIDSLSAQLGNARVTLDDGRTLESDLVVGADGAASRTRDLAGIDTIGWSYDQRAVVTHVSTSRPHEETAWQRFLTTGPLAFLPLSDGRCSIVWSTTPALADELLAMDEADFLTALNDASDRVLGDVTGCGPRGGFPLRLVHAARYTAPGLALVGDAAHAVHPLAGQGVNLGFLDAAALAEVLSEAREAGYRLGDAATLRRYERWRKGENLLTMATLDGLKRLFGTDDPLVAQLRQTGLKLVNRLAPVKDTLIRRAMGLEGDLPAIVRRH